MAAVTWKNIAPMNPSGILNSMNQSAKQIGEAGTGIENAISGYVDDRQTSETNAFVADLMGAGSEEERNAMIGAANTSFLDLDRVNKTNYELGAPDREMDMFNQKLASESVINEQVAQKLHDNKMLQIDRTGSYKTPAASKSGPGSTGWGKTPIGSQGIFSTNYPTNDNVTGRGGGYDADDDAHFVRERGNFLNSSYATDLTNTLGIKDMDGYFNQLANDELITFEDRFTGLPGILGGGGDMFVFTTKDGVKHDLDGSKESQAAISELIMNTYFKASDGGMMLSPRQIDKKTYYDAFTANNPKLVEDVGYSSANDIFTKIYNKNIKFNSNRLDTENINKVFKTLTTTERSSSMNVGDKYSAEVFDQAKPQAEKLAKEMSQEELENFVKEMIEYGDSKSDFNWALTDHLQSILNKNAK